MSQSAYDYKYSDRDVRENSDLRHLALNYIEGYGGSFEPLLRVKYILAASDSEDVLTTAQIRLILNCMRHDPAVAGNMPAPRLPYFEPVRVEQIAPIIPIQRDRRRGPRARHCGNPEPHKYHTESRNSDWCNGTPFPINRRRRIATGGRIKWAKFAAAKSGLLVHKLTGEAIFEWEPNEHEWGFAKDHPVEVSVKTNCKNPSWIHGGYLFEVEPIRLYADEAFAKSRCSRCFTATEL